MIGINTVLLFVAVADVLFPKGRNEGCQTLRQVGILYDRWQHHLSPPPHFRHGTGAEGNILQPPALVSFAYKAFGPTNLTRTYSDFWHGTATDGSDVVQSGRPIFDDFFQHLWPYIGNNTANVVFQMVKRLWLIRIEQ
ncbi:hypothetical protein TNCV_2150481 [Trichonephila clavipes]|nr:hypothetical protein TNCV_2150481 [Trichonephila clavipes]